MKGENNEDFFISVNFCFIYVNFIKFNIFILSSFMVNIIFDIITLMAIIN